MDQQGIYRNKASDEKLCGACGEPIKIMAEICPKCGVRQRNPISKAALLLFTFFLGGIGAHKFYTGRYWQGVLYILFCWTGIPGLIALIEFIIYAFTSSEKLQQKYSAGGGGGVVIAVVAGCIGFFVVVGILAAIAIPQFVSYRHRAHQVMVENALQNVSAAQDAYFVEHSRFSPDLQDLNLDPSGPNVIVEITSADETCFEAVGRHAQLEEPISIDCNGLRPKRTE